MDLVKNQEYGYRCIITVTQRVLDRLEAENTVYAKIEYKGRKEVEMIDILLFYENDDSLLLFRKLCKYYFSINLLVTAQYINYYREQNDPEGVKFGNKAKAIKEWFYEYLYNL